MSPTASAVRPYPDCPLVVAYGLGVDSTAMLVEFASRGIRIASNSICANFSRMVRASLCANRQTRRPRQPNPSVSPFLVSLTESRDGNSPHTNASLGLQPYRRLT